jgi:hypothetical protein
LANVTSKQHPHRADAPGPPAPAGRPARLRRGALWLGKRAAVATLSAAALGLVGWGTIHRFPGVAVSLVNAARAVVGARAIAWVEDQAYGVDDAVKRATSSGEPLQYWEAPAALPTAASSAATPAASRAASSAPLASASPGGAPSSAPFPPPPFAPPFPGVALANDGTWVPLASRPSALAPDDRPVMVKALVHPDPKRSFSAVAVVAIDLARAEISLVPGTTEPISAALPRERRTGLVPASQRDDLIAAFNGGFMTEHGRFGMMVEGATLLPPRASLCTVARYKSGALRVAPWSQLSGDAASLSFYRQTPPCLVEHGEVNRSCEVEENTSFGSAVGGGTFIRRSAFGLDETRRVAFFGMGDSLTALSIARALRAAGARDVAELDVNWAYPRFLIYAGAAGEAPRVSETLIKSYGWVPESYVDRAEWRDFFYVTRKRPLACCRPAAAVILVALPPVRRDAPRSANGPLQSSAAAGRESVSSMKIGGIPSALQSA